MKVILKGYFDHNFGDDYMLKTIVRNLPEVSFILTHKNKYTGFILREPNVSYCDKPEKGLPSLLIIGSGFMINSFEALKCEIRWFFTKKRIADCCFGCNIEKLGTRLKEYLIKKKLSQLDMVVCRDKKSYEWLTSRLKKTKVYYLPDILFSARLGIDTEKASADKLGISLFHRLGDAKDCDYYKKMAAAADYYIETTGKSVILMAFDSGSENDGFACKSVKKLMRHGDKATVVYHKNRDEIINAYAECEKIIGARFHSAVLALKTGIDFFPIVCRDKMRNIIEDVGYETKGCDINDIDLEEIKRFLESGKTGKKADYDPDALAAEYVKLFKSRFGEA